MGVWNWWFFGFRGGLFVWDLEWKWFLLQNQLMGAYRHTLNDKLLLNYGRQKQTPSPVFPSTPSKSSN